MASIIYLKINGERQGLISAGASSVDSIGNKYQSGMRMKFLYMS